MYDTKSARHIYCDIRWDILDTQQQLYQRNRLIDESRNDNDSLTHNSDDNAMNIEHAKHRGVHKVRWTCYL